MSGSALEKTDVNDATMEETTILVSSRAVKRQRICCFFAVGSHDRFPSKSWHCSAAPPGLESYCLLLLWSTVSSWRWFRRGREYDDRLTGRNPQRDERTHSRTDDLNRGVDASITCVDETKRRRSLKFLLSRHSRGQVPIGTAAASALDRIPIFTNFFVFVAVRRPSLGPTASSAYQNGEVAIATEHHPRRRALWPALK